MPHHRGVASAADRAVRDEEIAAAHAAGESVRSLSERFGLSLSRVKEVMRAGPPLSVPVSEGVRLAFERREEYRRVAAEVRDLAGRLPDSQASAKVGSYKLLLDSLDRLTALDRALGLLPSDLGRLHSDRAVAETVLAVLVEHDVSAEARRDLVERLAVDEELAA